MNSRRRLSAAALLRTGFADAITEPADAESLPCPVRRRRLLDSPSARLREYEGVPAEPPGSPAPSFTHPIDIRRFSWATPLACDYCHAYEQLASFFPGDPTAPESWHQAIAARQAARGRAGPMAEVLAAQLGARDAPPEAQAAAQRLAAPGAVAIVTGQQAGLFGGPLFTLLKALTAIALARRVAAEHGVDAVPVFWVDAEDHDLDEVRTCAVPDRELALRRLELDAVPEPGQPVAGVRLPPSIGALVETLRETLPPTEFSDATLDCLTAAYAPGRSMSAAFSRWLDTLLGRHGLVVFDGADPAAKPLVQDVFEQELLLPGETARLAAAAGAQLTDRGYHAQVTPAAGAVALFRLNGGRLPIRLDDDAFAIGESLFSSGALIRQVRDQPQMFSPNVLLRPIVQDTLFPTAAYVSGPNELGYMGQLREVYRRFGVPMPLIYPRLSATVLDRAALKFLARHDLGLERLQARDDAALNGLINAQLPPAVEAAVAAAEQQGAVQLDSIAELVTGIDPTLAGAARTTKQRMERDLRTLRAKIVQAAKRRDTTLRRQFQRTRAQAFPDGAPQERAVSFVYFINRYGPGVVDRLLADLPLDVGRHWLLTL